MTRLADVANINPRLEARPSPDAPVSFISMASVNASTGSTDREEGKRFSDTAKGYTQFKNGDILVAKITPCFENGKIARAELTHDLGSGSTEFHVVRPNPDIADTRYVLHYLRQPSIRIDGAQRMTGSGGQRRVPESFISELDIPLPVLSEQRRIANVLDQADSLRRQCASVLSKAEALFQADFRATFGSPLRNEAGWPYGQVSDFVEGFESGKSLAAAEESESARYRVLKVSAVTSGRFIADESKALPHDYEPPRAHLVRSGDLLFSRANTAELIGATALVADCVSNLALPDKLWRFVWRDDRKTSPYFALGAFQHEDFRAAVSMLATGSSGSMKNISQAKVLGIGCILPPYEVQAEFAARCVGYLAQAAGQAARLSRVSDLFDSLQHRAFHGQL